MLFFSMVEGAGYKCINNVSLNPAEGEPKICQLINLILTLFVVLNLQTNSNSYNF